MKKLKYVFLLVIIIIIIFIIFFISQVNGKEKSDNYDLKQKAQSEILFLDSKIVYIINGLNNIIDSNYYVSIQEVNQNQDASQTSNTSANKGQSGDASGQKSSSGAEGSEKQTTRISQMIPDVIFERSSEIDWTNYEGIIQTINSSWSVIILDLYKLNVDSNEILSFSTKLDDAIQAVKSKEKDASITSLANLYEFLPRFLNSFSDNNELKTAINVKSKVINAYAQIQVNNWDSAKQEIAEADGLFTDLLNSIPENENSIFNINKTYIVLKELQNSLNKQDKDIFYLKYRNIISELSIIQSYL